MKIGSNHHIFPIFKYPHNIFVALSTTSDIIDIHVVSPKFLRSSLDYDELYDVLHHVRTSVGPMKDERENRPHVFIAGPSTQHQNECSRSSRFPGTVAVFRTPLPLPKLLSLRFNRLHPPKRMETVQIESS